MPRDRRSTNRPRANLRRWRLGFILTETHDWHVGDSSERIFVFKPLRVGATSMFSEARCVGQGRVAPFPWRRGTGLPPGPNEIILTWSATLPRNRVTSCGRMLPVAVRYPSDCRACFEYFQPIFFQARFWSGDHFRKILQKAPEMVRSPVDRLQSHP